jgi:hypothetical protein
MNIWMITDLTDGSLRELVDRFVSSHLVPERLQWDVLKTIRREIVIFVIRG